MQTEIGKIGEQLEWLSSENYQIRLQLGSLAVRNLGTKILESSIRLGQFCYVMVWSIGDP